MDFSRLHLPRPNASRPRLVAPARRHVKRDSHHGRPHVARRLQHPNALSTPSGIRAPSAGQFGFSNDLHPKGGRYIVSPGRRPRLELGRVHVGIPELASPSIRMPTTRSSIPITLLYLQDGWRVTRNLTDQPGPAHGIRKRDRPSATTG